MHRALIQRTWRSRFRHGKEDVMPDDDGRTTYPAAPTKGGNSNAPLPEDATGASSPPDAVTAPSAEPQEQVSEPAPPPSSQPEPERKFHMPPPERWEELRRERDDARRLAELALQKLQPPLTPPAPPQEDHWKGLVDHPDPATAQFYQQQRALFQLEAERMADQKLQGVLQVVDAGRRELAQIKISQFRKENPEIKPNSPEETAIAAYVQQGMDLETAKKLALYDTLEAENRALKSKHAAIPRKAAANVESTAGIPESAGLPGKPGDWRQKAGEILDKGGDFVAVANTLFGRKRNG